MSLLRANFADDGGDDRSKRLFTTSSDAGLLQWRPHVDEDAKTRAAAAVPATAPLGMLSHTSSDSSTSSYAASKSPFKSQHPGSASVTKNEHDWAIVEDIGLDFISSEEFGLLNEGNRAVAEKRAQKDNGMFSGSNTKAVEIAADGSMDLLSILDGEGRKEEKLLDAFPQYASAEGLDVPFKEDTTLHTKKFGPGRRDGGKFFATKAARKPTVVTSRKQQRHYHTAPDELPPESPEFELTKLMPADAEAEAEEEGLQQPPVKEHEMSVAEQMEEDKQNGYEHFAFAVPLYQLESLEPIMTNNHA